MAGYEYNPLLKLDLQKKSAVSPSDIQHLEHEIASINEDITDINGDLKNKVPKFFTSIEELEIGEIGQYQGETNDTFVHGYFYERGTGELTPVFTEVDTVTLLRTTNLLGYSGAKLSLYQTQLDGELPLLYSFDDDGQHLYSLNIYPSAFGLPIASGTFVAIVCPSETGIISDCYLDNFQFINKIVTGYLTHFYYGGQEFLNKFENGNLYILYDGIWYPLLSIPGAGGGSLRLNIYQCYMSQNDHLVQGVLLDDFSETFALNTTATNHAAYAFHASVPPSFDLSFWNLISDTRSLFEFQLVLSPSSQRVDTQPALNPADFATAAQGAKADTALQAITHGTDGNYVTSTIGAKDANNEQSVSVSLKLQPISTAGSGAKGLAEASDVKDYIGNNTATPSQGSKADSALQGVVHGTDGLYITTTVSTKDANNEQTIYTALTLQDIETADASHKGVAEASNVRNFFNVIAAESEAYGVMWDSANPSPNLTRIGNMRNHALLPVQSAMIGGVLADDGTFTPFDNQADWTLATQSRDGSDGQVMVRLPQHWRRCEKSGTYNIVMISPIAIPGYVEVRQQYVSAYEATLQHSTSKLCSVNNADADYRGGQNEASWDGTYRTLLNRPITNYNLAEFRTFARNRANNTKWNCLTYEAVRTIYWLFVTEYATLNSQADFNSALDANGFRQGGLGIGVSDWTGDSWDAYNGYAPLIPCGMLDEYGSGTAIKNFSVYNADTTLAHTFSCNKYRGIEMPFAHIWKYADGVLVNVESGNGVSTVYATTDTSYFSSTSFANYAEICNSYRVDSYIKDIVFNKEGDIFAISPNGNSTSYYCDQHWGGNLPSATELRAWRFGGFAHSGALCGLACSTSNSGVGHRGRGIGSRLCFVP